MKEAIERATGRRVVEADRVGGGCINEGWRVELDDGTRALRCAVCQHRLGGYEDDHKRATLIRERPLRDLSPHNRRCAESFVVREFFCPGCLTSVALDVQDGSEPIIDESALRAPDAPT